MLIPTNRKLSRNSLQEESHASVSPEQYSDSSHEIRTSPAPSPVFPYKLPWFLCLSHRSHPDQSLSRYGHPAFVGTDKQPFRLLSD